MHKIAILIYPNTPLFELGCVAELFALPRPEIKNWYKTKIVSFELKPVSATGNIMIQAEIISDFESFDSIIIPGWPIQNSTIDPILKKAFLSAHKNNKRLISICSGSFLLANLGLLDNKKATTHWRYSEQFKHQFKQVKYLENVLYTQHDNLFCSAGSASALDLGLEIIRQDFGHQIANSVARRLVISPHRSGGQAQYVESPIPSHNEKFKATLEWAETQVHQSISIDVLANHANMSRRSFDRHFRASVGMSAKKWLDQLRLDKAKTLLESEKLPIDQVAEYSGFVTPESLRHHFKLKLGVSPSQFRHQFFNSP